MAPSTALQETGQPGSARPLATWRLDATRAVALDLHLEPALDVPRRAYRRARIGAGPIALSLIALALVEGGLWLGLGPLTRTWVLATHRLVAWTGTLVWIESDTLLGVTLPVLGFVIPPPDFRVTAAWLAGALLGLLGLHRARTLAMPLRLLVGYHLVLVSSSALYLLHAGHLGYDAETFSRLYVRTTVLVWLVAPPFITALALVLPLGPGARLLAALGPLAYDVLLGSVRYAVLVWALGQTGSVLLANFYLFFGPLLDAVVLVAVFVLILPAAARRLEPGRGPWRW